MTESKTVEVPNITCGHCVSAIEREVGEVPGVTEVEGSPATRQVKISWDPETTDWVVIEDLMTEINYPPTT